MACFLAHEYERVSFCNTTTMSVNEVSGSEGRAFQMLLAAADRVGGHDKNPTNGRADPGSVETETGRAYPTPSSMAAAIDRMATVCSEHFAAINQRMDSLSQRVDTLTPVELSPSPTHTSTLDEITGTLGTPWADLSVSDSQPDYESFVIFPEEDSDLATEEGDGCEIRRVSKKTAAFLAEAFAKTVPNGMRRKLRQTFGMPQSEATETRRDGQGAIAQALQGRRPSNGPWPASKPSLWTL